MAVLIEKKYPYMDYSEENATVTAAVLPSGKVLAAPGANVAMLEDYASHFGPANGGNEEEMFRAIASIYKSPYSSDVWLVDDPQEAREIIKEAGLK